MAEDTSSLGSSITTSGDDLCEPDIDDDVPTLQKTLEMLSLSDYASTFEKERIDMESLVQYCLVDFWGLTGCRCSGVWCFCLLFCLVYHQE